MYPILLDEPPARFASSGEPAATVLMETLDAMLTFRDGAMRFSGIAIGPAGDTMLQKLTFHHRAADTVRQVFESLKDRGAT